MSRLRVGLICPYSVTIPGGVQSQVLGLARALRAAGHAAQVLAPADGNPPEPWITPIGVSVPTAANGSVAPLAPDPSAQLRAIRALRDERFDVLHVHEPLAPGPTMTSLLFAEAPIVATFHAAGVSASYRFGRWPLRMMLRRVSIRTAVSPDAVDLARRYLGGQYQLLYNGIEIDRFAQAEPTPTSGPTILFLGRHEPRKGLAVLLRAFERLGPDVRLWVAGSGPQSGELRDRYADDERIEWLGQIDDDEKAQRLRGADVFCAPAQHGESFGVVLLEAMAAGATVVASDLAGYRNVATDGHDAVLARLGDPGALADALARVLGDQTLAATLSAAGARTAQAHSMAGLADRYLGLYAEAISAAA